MYEDRRRPPIRVLVVSLVAATTLFALLGIRFWWRYAQRQAWQAGIRSALLKQQFSEIESLTQKLHASGDLPEESLFLAARAALQEKRFSDAVRWLELVPANSSRYVEAIAHSGEIHLLSLHQLSRAETCLRQVLDKDPDNLLARQQLAGLLGLTGRNREAAEQRILLIRARHFTRVDLILMGLRDTALENADQLEACRRSAPKDPLTELAVGYFNLTQHRLSEAEIFLRNAIAGRPDLLAAHVLLGQLLIEARKFSELPAWHRELPASATNDADIWSLFGDWHRELGDSPSAIRCYLEAIRRDPLQQQACFNVASLLQQAGRIEDAARFRHHAAQLQNLLIAVKHFHSGFDHQSIERIIVICKDLGMIWEAWAWSLAAQEVNPQQNWPRKSVMSLELQLPKEPVRVIPSANPIVGLNLAQFPLPVWSKLTGIRNESLQISSSATIKSQQISFREDSERVGLSFQYFVGSSPDSHPRVFEFAGGGVGVIDYDLDGWPDIHFTQGCVWPPSPVRSHYGDELFRNDGLGGFQNVTQSARLVETSYSHGIAVGDWNDDGFSDLFIGNAGPNRLFRNNGDGTFTDVTSGAGVAGDRWTTSCLIADVNGDGWPDLFSVNYLAGENLYDRICRGSDGRARICNPHDLEAAPDEFYMNLGDGRFKEFSSQSGLLKTTGKGLGIVAADFDGASKLSLFVANDTDGNQFFRNVGTSDRCQFEEQALPLGLAFDAEGRSLASMGVAAGDATGDGLLDLFITTYYGESNIFYCQQADGTFSDMASRTGLRTPSIEMLGFGTQFLDADLDGHLDLVLVNGHIEQDPRPEIPYQMRPQFLRNTRVGRFEELRETSLGEWFRRKRLGRGLATLDWNRDGRPDFAVSQIGHPASLLTNTSTNASNSIVVHLNGTKGNRDAVGAILKLHFTNRTLTRQIMAGDGYLASNEKICIFGLDQNEVASKLVVHWPSGVESVVLHPRSRTEYRLIEGRTNCICEQLSSLDESVHNK